MSSGTTPNAESTLKLGKISSIVSPEQIYCRQTLNIHVPVASNDLH